MGMASLNVLEVMNRNLCRDVSISPYVIERVKHYAHLAKRDKAQFLFEVPRYQRPMDVSVVINTYSLDRFDDFCDAVDAVLDQTYESIELILVVDGNEELYDRVTTEFGRIDSVICSSTQENVGNSASRNAGARLATGDIIVVTDDDGVADQEWIKELVTVYEETDALAAGGKVEPMWIDGKPDFFPEEFLWLVGCTERGFADHMEEVRNTYGPNLSFRREVFEKLGGFSEKVGRHGSKQLQAHETEICTRLRRTFDRGVIYSERAIINHKVYPYRTKLRWLLRRCFWQGYSKRVLEQLLPGSTGEESKFLRDLFFKHVPRRLKGLITGPSLAKVQQLVMIGVFTAVVGIGYIYGLVSVRGE